MIPAESQEQRAHPWPVILGFAADTWVFRHSLLGKNIITYICDRGTIFQRHMIVVIPLQIATLTWQGQTGMSPFSHRAPPFTGHHHPPGPKFFSSSLHDDSRDLRPPWQRGRGPVFQCWPDVSQNTLPATAASPQPLEKQPPSFIKSAGMSSREWEKSVGKSQTAALQAKWH